MGPNLRYLEIPHDYVAVIRPQLVVDLEIYTVLTESCDRGFPSFLFARENSKSKTPRRGRGVRDTARGL